MSDNKLILHPQNPNIGIINLDSFADELREVGLIGNKYVNYEFQAGERFLELINFVQNHCALVLDKGDIKEIFDNHIMCAVQIASYGEQTSLHGVNSYMQDCCLRCPSCNFEQDVNVVYKVLSAWYENQETYRWHCSQCAKSWHVYELNWQNGFAFARCAIDI